MKELKILYTISTYAFVIALIFVGGMYAGTKIIHRLNDGELAELADDFESDLGRARDEYRKQAELLERANQYLKDSIVEREGEAEHDKGRIDQLATTVERFQVAARESLDETGDIEKTIQRIEESADGIGEDVRDLRSEVQRVQEGKRDSDWWFATGEYDPEDQWRRLIDRLNRGHLYRSLQVREKNALP